MVDAHNCPICLSTFVEPVCLPCGHLFCRVCIRAHVNATTKENLTCECPTCRNVFHITIPDLKDLPVIYHPFIVHSMRRVYVDMSPQEALLRKYHDLERRFATKRRAEEALLRRCEALTATVQAHRDGEQEAVQRAEALEERLDEAENDFQQFCHETKRRQAGFEDEKQASRERQNRLAAQLEAVQNQLKHSEMKRRELERHISTRYAEDSNHSIVMPVHHASSSRDIPRERIIKPLPKRRVPRTREDDSVSLSMSKRPRIVIKSEWKTEWEDAPALSFY